MSAVKPAIVAGSLSQASGRSANAASGTANKPTRDAANVIFERPVFTVTCEKAGVAPAAMNVSIGEMIELGESSKCADWVSRC